MKRLKKPVIIVMTKAFIVYRVEPQDKKSACLMCQKMYKNLIELCTYCKKKLIAANSPNASIIESGLIKAFT